MRRGRVRLALALTACRPELEEFLSVELHSIRNSAQDGAANGFPL